MQFLQRSRRLAHLVWLFLLSFGILHASDRNRVEFEPWPQSVGTAAESLSLGPPRCLSWDYLSVELEAPIRLSLEGQGTQGTVVLQARTFANRATQEVLLTGFQVKALRTTGGEGREAEVSAVNRLLSGWNSRTGLEGFLRRFAGEKPLPSVTISSDTPAIFVARKPAALLQFDGAPMWLPVEDTKISFAVNTNWDIFYDNKSTFYYLLAGDLWLATHDPYSNEWVFPKSLPKEIRKLPHTPDFANVWAHLPYKPDPDAAMPRVIYSEKAAELIVLDGDPVLEPIPGTPIQVATNTASDLFFHEGSKRYYYLVAGRWYTTAELDGYWRNAGELPAEFAQIPEDHAKAHVRVHIPGTPESELEALWAVVPQLARIRRSEAKVKVDFAGRPKFVPIDGSRMLWVPNATVPVLALGADLYACHRAVWFHATSPEGPWKLADALPADIYRLPPNSAPYHLSYVRLVESDAETVTFGYTGGYENLFVHEGVVVYGTGYSHAPALQYGAYAYPVYFAQPATYGLGAWYSAKAHTFLRGRPGYGPFGGFGATCRYNSVTSHYFRAQTLYGDDDGAQPMLAFLPYTGSYGSVFETYDPYGTWGDAIVRDIRAPAKKRPAIAIKPGTPVVSAPGEPGIGPDTPGQALKPRKQ